MTDKEFAQNLVMSTIFYHKEYGRVTVSSLPSANGEVEAFSLDQTRPININIRDLVNINNRYRDLNNIEKYIK